MSVLLIYMSANLISAVMNLTLKAYTVSWKQVVVMNHQCNPSKGFFFFKYRIGIGPVEKAVAKCYLKSSKGENRSLHGTSDNLLLLIRLHQCSRKWELPSSCTYDHSLATVVTWNNNTEESTVELIWFLVKEMYVV